MTTIIIVAIVIATILILLSYTISHKNVYPLTFTNVNDESERRSQYECGIEVLEERIGIETRERVYIKFYIVGILFLIFDIETLLVYPASLLFFDINNTILYKAFTVLLLFLILLLIGLYYEYKKDIL